MLKFVCITHAFVLVAALAGCATQPGPYGSAGPVPRGQTAPTAQSPFPPGVTPPISALPYAAERPDVTP
jgi:hypothetical protein